MIIGSKGRRILLGLATSLAIGCTQRESDLSVSEILIPEPDTPIRVNSQLNLNVDASGTGPFQFLWSADRGTISDPTEAAVSYTAPDSPGPVKVTVEVKGGGGQVVRTRNFQIIESLDAPSDKVTLASPQDGDQVSCQVLVEGAYPPELKAKIWPVVLVGGRYHPQDEGQRAPHMANGKWRGTVRFGDCNRPPGQDKGIPFMLVVVTANDHANQVFEDYVRNAAPSFSGLPALPEGAEPQAEIGVVRQ